MVLTNSNDLGTLYPLLSAYIQIIHELKWAKLWMPHIDTTTSQLSH